MKCFVVLGALAVAVLSATAGTVLPPTPVSVCSTTDAVLDTSMGHSELAGMACPLNTMLSDWGLSPFPGIFLNTNPVRGLLVVFR